MEHQLPFISVLTPVLNEERHIEHCLQSLAQQTYPKQRYEILFADGGSSDRTLPVIQAFQRAHGELFIRFWERPGTGRECRLNLCVREARGTIIARIDAHSVVPPDYLETVAQILSAPPVPEVRVVGGPVELIAEGFLSQAIGLAMRSRFGMGHIDYRRPSFEGIVSTVQNASYDRKIFDEVGEFDETIGCEDSDLHYRLRRAGYKIFITPRLRFFYYPRRTLSGFMRQFMNYGRWRVRFFHKHQILPSARYVLPLVFVLAGLCAPVVLFAPTSFRWLLGWGAGTYATVALIFALWESRRVSLRFVPLLLFVYLLMHAAYGTGMWLEIFRIWVGRLRGSEVGRGRGSKTKDWKKCDWDAVAVREVTKRLPRNTNKT